MSRRASPRRVFFRRVDVRLTVWFSAVFLLTALLLFGFTYLRLSQTLRAEDRRQLQSLAIRYVLPFRAAVSQAAGINLMVNEISNDILQPTFTPFFARLANSNNESLVFAMPLPEWQEIDLFPLTSGMTPHADGFLRIPAPGLPYDLEVFGIRLSDQYILQIGGDTRNQVAALAAFQTGFLFAFAVMLGLSLAGGLLVASRTLRPISALNSTVRSIITTGELDRRIPTRDSNDDLDDMIGSVNLMLDRIQNLVTGLRDALDAVGHDLRTPLTRFRGIAERALSGSEELYAEALGDAMEESEMILGMLNAMMDISEAESGAMKLHRQPTDLLELAAGVSEVYALLAEEREMSIEVADGPLVAQSDPSRMRQVIGNLLDNAIKYGDHGSHIRVNGSREGGTVLLEVENEGDPIPPEERDRIWSRLYRAHGAADRRDGLGLGLALVRAVVEAHGGSANVRGDGRLTCFSIRIPADPNITEL